MEIELNQIDNKIDGTITYEKWNSKGELQSKSGLCSIVGTVKGGTAFIQIYSPKGKLQSEGKLLKDGDYIKFILSKYVLSILMPYVVSLNSNQLICTNHTTLFLIFNPKYIE